MIRMPPSAGRTLREDTIRDAAWPTSTRSSRSAWIFIGCLLRLADLADVDGDRDGPTGTGKLRDVPRRHVRLHGSSCAASPHITLRPGSRR